MCHRTLIVLVALLNLCLLSACGGGGGGGDGNPMAGPNPVGATSTILGKGVQLSWGTGSFSFEDDGGDLWTYVRMGSARTATGAAADLVGKWELVALEGALGPVDSSNSVWGFLADGTYQWYFRYPGYFDLSGSGRWHLIGTVLYIDGIVAETILAEATGSHSGCELVNDPQAPGFLKVINDLNEDVDVMFLELPFGATIRPGACELYGLPVGTQAVEFVAVASGARRTESFGLGEGTVRTVVITSGFLVQSDGPAGGDGSEGPEAAPDAWDTSGEDGDPDVATAPPAVPRLLSPPRGFVVPQNNPLIPCDADPERGYGFSIRFDWDDVDSPGGIRGYHVYVKKQDAVFPLVDTFVTDSEYLHVSCNGFVIDENLSGWEWSVQAEDLRGNVSELTEPNRFSFSPCRLPDGTACGTTSGTAPTPWVSGSALHTADAFITSSIGSNNAANTNYGAIEVLAVKHDTGLPGNNRKTYIRFDLSGAVPPFAEATLRLTYAGTNRDRPANPSTYSVYGLVDGHPGENWDEGTITWNNAPGNSVSSAGGLLPGDVMFLGAFTLNVPTMALGAPVSFSSPELLDFVQRDTNGVVTLILTRLERNFSIEYFASRESPDLPPPSLELRPAARGATESAESARFDIELRPGVWHGSALSKSSERLVYLVDLSPLEPPAAGGFIERYVVQPEFDGTAWWDVLRVMIPSDASSLLTGVEVYGMTALPVVADFDCELQPGEWHGFVVGESSARRAYLVEISPLEPSTDGATVERYVVQPEFDAAAGTWRDVLRVATPAGALPLLVNVRIYEATELPIIADFDVELQPGEWQGYILGESSQRRAFVVEISPLEPSTDGATIERYVVQPEHDGTTWQDVLRMVIPENQPPLRANVRVYAKSPD